MFQDVRSQSMNTGTAPRNVTGETLPIKVNVEASTSSPGPTHSSRRARCMAAVPLERATQCLIPVYSEKFSFKRVDLGAQRSNVIAVKCILDKTTLIPAHMGGGKGKYDG